MIARPPTFATCPIHPWWLPRPRPRIRPLAAAPRIRPRICPSCFSLAPPSHLWPIFWHLSMIFLHLSTIFRHLSKAVRLLCARYPPHSVTCRCAVHLWPRYSASTSEYCIDKTGEESVRLYSCRRCGPFVVVYGSAQGSGPEPRINSCPHTRAHAGPGTRSQHGRKNKTAWPHLTVARRHLPSLLGGHGEQWVLLAVAVVKRKL